jgi:hypothetical protein
MKKRRGSTSAANSVKWSRRSTGNDLPLPFIDSTRIEQIEQMKTDISKFMFCQFIN